MGDCTVVREAKAAKEQRASPPPPAQAQPPSNIDAGHQDRDRGFN
jgi:hypothetical protein